MPQLQIGSANINNFFFSATFDLLARTVTLDASGTSYVGSGVNNVHGIAFAIQDQDGVDLCTIDWTAPQIPTPASSAVYVLDLSSLNYPFLFQTYSITGSIKDQNGTIYTTTPVFKKVCQPVNFNDSGYVPGMFQILPDCTNNILTIKELSLLVYNNLIPSSVSKTGILNYPTGTISAINFANTPFSNNIVYTGQYRINCTTVATYDLGDAVYVNVSYVTKNVFDVSCNNKMSDVICCIEGIQNTYLKDCNSAIGKNAKQQLDSIQIPLLLGLTKEINGMDASDQALLIKKQLNCDCGVSSLGQNEVTPVNPSIYSIVLEGVGGTTVPDAVVTGSTKTYSIASNVYQVVKGNTGDLAYSITLDTSVANTVKYRITFNYDTMAGYILTAIANDPTLINQLNSLITVTGGVNLAGLNGSCVIDLTKSDYILTQAVNNSTFITQVVINGTVFAAPTNLFGTDFVGISNWLNGLALGTFTVAVNAGVLSIQALQNVNAISTMTFTTPNLTVLFNKNSKTLVQVLQAIIDHLCGLTALQVALGNSLSLCLFDYNGVPISYNYTGSNSQNDYNLGISQSICNIVARMNTLTGITCDKLKAAFPDSPGAPFGSADRLYGTLNSICAGLTDQQIANLVIAAVGKYSDVKAAFCAIDCTAPATCPDISSINMNVLGSAIAIYGATYSQTPTASQTVTVRYRVHGTSTWLVATNALVLFPNGNVSGTSPYQIPGLTAGTTYDVWINNNCGGSGFVSQITLPTGSVYSGSFLLDNIIYNICGETPVTLYSIAPFGSGVTMYYDSGLTTPVTGFTYISGTSGNIFQINTGSGIVGADTGSACSHGTPGNYRLSNSTGTVCAAAPTVLYTNGAFAVGGTLYTDMALTHPLTGYSYVVRSGDNTIYNLNSTTGVVGASTGLSCASTSTINVINFGDSALNITGVKVNGVPVVLTSNSFPLSAGDTAQGYTTQIGTYAVEVDTAASIPGSNISVTGSDGVSQCINTGGGTTYIFTGIVINTATAFSVQAGGGACF